MIFYRVRSEYDNIPKNPKIHDGQILIGLELYTVSEFNKLPYIYCVAFDRIDIPKKSTYIFFGARFENEVFS